MGQLLRRSAMTGATVFTALAATGFLAPAATALSAATDPAATTVTLVVGTVSGPAFQRVPLTATVAGADPAATPTGSCTFRDRGVVLAQVAVGPVVSASTPPPGSCRATTASPSSTSPTVGTPGRRRHR